MTEPATHALLLNDMRTIPNEPPAPIPQPSGPIATDGGHWYTLAGEPLYTIVGSNGVERPVTLRDARKLNLLPGVSSILRVIDKPALGIWMQKQGIDATLAWANSGGETDRTVLAESEEDYYKPILAAAKEESVVARDRGSALHGAIERWIAGRDSQEEWDWHIQSIVDALDKVGIDLTDGEIERSFGGDGYGGRIDWHVRTGGGIVLDFKSKGSIAEERAKAEKKKQKLKLAWDEQAMQLAAYRDGIELRKARCINVFVGVDDAEVVVYEWPEEEMVRAAAMFECSLRLWQLQKRYVPELAAEVSE